MDDQLEEPSAGHRRGHAGIKGRRARFVLEYLKDRNATAAYKRAGYRDTPNARYSASKLLAEPAVRAAVEAMAHHVAARAALDAAYVLENLQEVVERCMQRAPVLTTSGEQVVDAEGRNVWMFDARGAVTALIALGNHLGLFKGDRKPAPPGQPLEIVRITIVDPRPVPAVTATLIADEPVAGRHLPSP